MMRCYAIFIFANVEESKRDPCRTGFSGAQGTSDMNNKQPD